VSEFAYLRGHLHAEGVPLADIARAVGTPVYVYSAAALRRTYRAYAEAFAGQQVQICYALKANGNLAVVRVLALEGAGADVVSEGELRRALAGGVAADKIVFSGVGKSESELAFAIEAGIAAINVESEPELIALGRIAAARTKRLSVSLRINPDIDAATHAKITTGRSENKFGVPYDSAVPLFARAAEWPSLSLDGLAVHIGSQLLSLDPFRRAFERVAGLVRTLRGAGHTVRRLDLGGGVGIRYAGEEPPRHADYARIVRETVGALGCTLVIEPGRSIVGEAGALLTRILYLKENPGRRFAIVDAAMNDLLRPALYDAYHEIAAVRDAGDTERRPVDVVGPVCESSDIFAKDRLLPPLESGDLLAFLSAGAYGSVMASTYNSRPLIPEVLVDGTRYAVVRPRQSFEALLGQDRVPDWLTLKDERKPERVS
jgi:diaminopimelate decarboxylase